MTKKLTKSEIQDRLQKLTGWNIENNKITKEMLFPDFATAFGFMSSIAIVADSMNHHPEWFNVHNKVKIWLTTHEADGVSENDINLARKIDAFWETKRTSG